MSWAGLRSPFQWNSGPAGVPKARDGPRQPVASSDEAGDPPVERIGRTNKECSSEHGEAKRLENERASRLHPRQDESSENERLGVGIWFDHDGVLASMRDQFPHRTREFRQFVGPRGDAHVGRALHLGTLFHHQHRRTDFADEHGRF